MSPRGGNKPQATPTDTIKTGRITGKEGVDIGAGVVAGDINNFCFGCYGSIKVNEVSKIVEP